MLVSRLEELDLLRGLSVIGMILVITPGNWSHNFGWLAHADWEGLVAVDMIAPAFLFCIGFAIPLALKKRIENGVNTTKIFSQILVRSILLILLGITINWTRNFEINEVRIPGVLQRIGLSYFLVACLVLFLARLKSQTAFLVSIRSLTISTAIILVSYWALFYFVAVPSYGANQFNSFGSWASYIDQLVFGLNHMWVWGQTDGKVTYDPDGLLCSISTSANVLIGAIVCLLHQQNSPLYRKRNLFGLGLGLFAIGLLTSPWCPIVKKIWTSSFVLCSSGISLCAFVALQTIKDQQLLKIPFHVFKVFGANALLAFAFSWLSMMYLLNIPIYKQGDNGVSLRDVGFQALNKVIDWPELASLSFGIIFIVLIYFVLNEMFKRQIFVRL